MSFRFVLSTKPELKKRQEIGRGLRENMKIDCGQAHFAEFDEVEFREVTKLSDMAH